MKLYTKTICPKCMLVKTLLDEAGVEYEVINIEENALALEKLKDKGFMAVPIVEYDGEFYADNKSIQELISKMAEK